MIDNESVDPERSNFPKALSGNPSKLRFIHSTYKLRVIRSHESASFTAISRLNRHLPVYLNIF